MQRNCKKVYPLNFKLILTKKNESEYIPILRIEKLLGFTFISLYEN